MPRQRQQCKLIVMLAMLQTRMVVTMMVVMEMRIIFMIGMIAIVAKRYVINITIITTTVITTTTPPPDATIMITTIMLAATTITPIVITTNTGLMTNGPLFNLIPNMKHGNTQCGMTPSTT